MAKNPIQPVASACSSRPPTGRWDRSMGPMLSRPRKPPSNRLLPSASSRLTHQVKLISSLSNTRLRKATSVPPSMAKTSRAAHACTGGFTSPKSHSYAGSAPPGCWNHSRHSRISWYLAKPGSRCARATQWKAMSQAANHGYSHLSGIDMMSSASKLRHREFRPVSRCGGGAWLGGVPIQPAGHRVAVELLAPQHPGERLAGHHRLVRGRAGRGQLRVELVGLGLAPGEHLGEGGPERVSAAVRAAPHWPPRPGAAGASAQPAPPAAP